VKRFRSRLGEMLKSYLEVGVRVAPHNGVLVTLQHHGSSDYIHVAQRLLAHLLQRLHVSVPSYVTMTKYSKSATFILVQGSIFSNHGVTIFKYDDYYFPGSIVLKVNESYIKLLNLIFHEKWISMCIHEIRT
jgi:hypothetical protein